MDVKYEFICQIFTLDSLTDNMLHFMVPVEPSDVFTAPQNLLSGLNCSGLETRLMKSSFKHIYTDDVCRFTLAR